MAETPQSTSLTLLSRLRDRADSGAWREFDARYRELLLRFCRRRGLSHTDAEDAVQHVFSSLSRALANFQYEPQRGRFRDYLYRCTRNAITAIRNSPKGEPQPLYTIEGPAGETPDADPADAAIWEEEWVGHHYRLAMETIRQTFEPQSLRIFERSLAGASIDELCAELDLKPDAVYKARQRVRGRMQELIAQQIREEDENPGIQPRPL